MTVLSPPERIDAVATLHGWTVAADEKSIARSLEFADFGQAFGFMTAVAQDADAADHHPDWSNSYRTVEIALSTHSEGGLTQADVDLAAKIDAHAVAFGAERD